ncbi:MAG: GntR family transcriptional regulator [Betaproteobacteria bacterium]|nr:GntR family transcriptional regulator [Betaproteobacteria bacterium]
MTRYEQLAQEITRQIGAGVLRAGERIPSVRQACAAQGVSPGTVQQAYQLLEDRGLIQTRPRSGYYVNATFKAAPAEPATSRPPRASTVVDVSELVFEILESVKSETVVPLGSAFIHPSAFPLAKLARFLGGAARGLDPRRMVADLPPGNRELRRGIARRYLGAGLTVDPEEVLITNGAMEALNLCLQAVAKPGDTIAIEGPAFYAALQAIERLGMKALALPTHPREGVDLQALEKALGQQKGQQKIAACWLMTSFQNPLGSLMSEEKRRALVALLAAREVPLIVDDVYEELYFGRARPKPAKAWDSQGLVLHCSSFSKCLAPGYRIGWALAGRYAQQVRRLKMTTTLATAIPPQAALADYLKQGGYDHHLRGLRTALQRQQGSMVEAIGRDFPVGTRVTQPQGGYFLWVELPAQVDALEVHRRAAAKNISVAPGPIFSPQRRYENCLRLNYGQPWTPQVEAALATLGKIAEDLC